MYYILGHLYSDYGAVKNGSGFATAALASRATATNLNLAYYNIPTDGGHYGLDSELEFWATFRETTKALHWTRRLCRSGEYIDPVAQKFDLRRASVPT